MELLKLMSDRYTCRRYSEKDVKEEDLNKILEAGRVAPTSHNNQPQRIYVVKSEEAKEKLMKDFAYNYKAPCYLVCGYNVDEVWRNDLRWRQRKWRYRCFNCYDTYDVNGRRTWFRCLLDRTYNT